MAKKAKADRTDPNKNKSLAIRTVLEKLPNAKAAEIAEAVKSEFGHTVTPTLIYLVKSKANVKAARRGRQRPTTNGAGMGSAAEWVQSIKLARQLLKATGSIENASAILKAVDA
jgi:hypothetical protein